MSSASLQTVAQAIITLAKRQGFITSRDIKAELRIAELPAESWKEVIALTAISLVHRQNRYYPRESMNPRLARVRAQEQAIQKAIRRLIKQYRQARKRDERRSQVRVDFVQPVKVRTEEGKQLALMSRDLSTTGVRLLGTHRLLGQKVQLELSENGGQALCRLAVRILWTCAVADNLFENGGSFLELLS